MLPFDYLRSFSQIRRPAPVKLTRKQAQLKDTAQNQDAKTGRTAPDIRKTLGLRKVLNIRKILPLLDDRNGTHGVSEARENKAGRPVLDAEEVTVSPSINAKGSRILFSKDLYIYPVKED